MQTFRVEGTCSISRQIACLEACEKLHKIGALSDYLIPVIDEVTEDDNIGGWLNFLENLQFLHFLCDMQLFSFYLWHTIVGYAPFSAHLFSILLLPGDQASTFEEDNYFPGELVSSWSSFCRVGLYQCYKISMNSVDFENFKGEIFLVVKCDLGSDFSSNSFNLETSKGSLHVQVDYFGNIHLDRDQVRYFSNKVLH